MSRNTVPKDIRQRIAKRILWASAVLLVITAALAIASIWIGVHPGSLGEKLGETAGVTGVPGVLLLIIGGIQLDDANNQY